MAAQTSLSLAVTPDEADAIQRIAAIETGGSVAAYLSSALHFYRLLTPEERRYVRQVEADGQRAKLQAAVSEALADLQLHESLAAVAPVLLTDNETAALAAAGDDADAQEDAAMRIARSWHAKPIR